MTSRPPLATKHRRPLSAIYLGNSSQLPDLPEPPSSPGSSGLPSPPATNSTGSGSNGGDSSQDSVELPPSLMQNGKGVPSNGPRRTSRSPSDEGDGVNDEDSTARLLDGKGPKSNENQSALQRVKSLAQRNQQVLSRIDSISAGSRLSRPSSVISKRRSPAPSNSTGTSSRVASYSSRRRSESMSRASGSETERESYEKGASDSEDLSETPTSTTGSHFLTSDTKERRRSTAFEQNQGSRFPLRERSVEPSEDDKNERRTYRPESRAGDIEAAALAAVANSRRHSPGDSRRRQPLPRELRADSFPEPPATPRRDRGSPGSHSNYDSPSARTAMPSDSPQSPHVRPHRISTIREMTRKHQTRWLSQDVTSPPKLLSDDDTGRPQDRRSGSDERPGRSVLGESLKAAGLLRRRDDDDVFGEAGRRLRISSEVGSRPLINRGEVLRSASRAGDRSMSSDVIQYSEPRTPANYQPYAVAQRGVQSAQADRERPSTSMSAYQEEPRTAPPMLRTYKPSYQSPDMDRINNEVPGRPLSRNMFALSSTASNERFSASAFGRQATASNTSPSPLNIAAASASPVHVPEHTRLMHDSLNMFESQLSRLPSMGSTTTVTIPELFRSAHNIVHASDTLNGLLRRGTAHALEEQIDAEVGEDGRPIDLVSLWRDVGAEYRESVRVCDELVRTMTSFLLGVGKVLRESMAEGVHNRAISLDDTMLRRQASDVGVREHSLNGSVSRVSEEKLSSDGGRSSLDGKRRWDASSGEMGRTTTSFTSVHSGSVHSLHSSSSRPSVASSKVDELGFRSESDISARKLNRLSLNASRRVESPQDFRDLQTRNVLQDSRLEDITMTNDSPSAAAAARQQVNSSRRANTLAMPPPLPTLPSESLLTRRSASIASKASITRRQKAPSMSAARTTASSIFPTIGSSEPTTAVNTTSASPERPVVANQRSSTSMRRTYSRTSGAAAAELQEQMDRDGRKRTISATSALESEIRQHKTNSSIVSVSDTEGIGVRTRSSLDSNTISTTRMTNRDRRGTMTGLFRP